MSFLQRVLVVLGCLWGATRVGFVCLDLWFPLSVERVKDTSFCVYDQRGRMLHMMLSPRENMRRMKAHLDAVDAAYIKALVFFEDKRFYTHGGVDIWAFARALKDFFACGRVVSGASTITMQAVRLCEPHPRSLWNKLKECVYAWHLERRFSKDDILSLYLTLAPYGSNIEGVRAASLAYFGHEADALGPEEQAFLIVLPRAPTALCPKRGDKALKVRALVLQAMKRCGLIDEENYVVACQQALPDGIRPRPQFIPHLSARLRHATSAHQARVFIDLDVQRHVEKVVAGANHMVAAMVLDTRTHQVVAYVGSNNAFSHENHGFIDYALAVRSPGSTLKPFIYALAFERAMIQEDTRVQDFRRRFLGYAPGNFDETFRGDISVKMALRLSLNTPVVYLLDLLGVGPLIHMCGAAGVRLRFSGEPSLAIGLGGCGVTLESMMVLYTTLFHGVSWPMLYTKDVFFGQKSEVFTPETAWAVRRMLLHKNFADGRGVSLKTGTSQGHKDAWCFGWDQRYVVGVWCGHYDGRSLVDCEGASSAAPIVENIFSYLPRQKEATLESQGETDAVILKPRNRLRLLSDKQPLRIHSPCDQGVFVVQKECVLPVDIRGAEGDVLFYVNGRVLALEKQAEGYIWKVEREGLYTLSVVDSYGRSDSIQVLVRMTQKSPL